MLALLAACSRHNGSLAAAGPVQAAEDKDMVPVPAGEFIMGSDKVDKEGLQQQYGFESPLYLNEHPQRRLRLPASGATGQTWFDCVRSQR